MDFYPGVFTPCRGVLHFTFSINAQNISSCKNESQKMIAELNNSKIIPATMKLVLE